MMKCISVNGLLLIFLFVVINLEYILGLPYYCKTKGTVTNCFQNRKQLISFPTSSGYPNINGSQNYYYYLKELPSNEDYQKYNNLELINFKYCYFTQIKKHAFKELNNLRYLILFHNNITDIDEKAFYNLGALKELFLGFNSIKHIHKDAFYNLPNLEKITLYENDIVELQDGTFSQLGKLNQLNLVSNPLIKFQENLFGVNKNNFLAEDSFLWLPYDNMACDSELLWIIEIFKYAKSPFNLLEFNLCWLIWNGEGILDLNIKERYSRYLEAEATSNQSNNLGQSNITSTSSGAQLASEAVPNRITIINPSINTYVTLNYCHTPEDEDDTPDFEYK